MYMENNTTHIQVLGSGCPTCKKLFERTQQVVEELGLNIEVEYITDIQKIVEMGVMSSPVLAIDDKPVMSGSLPEVEKIKEIISSHTTKVEEKEKGCCTDTTCDIECDSSKNNDTSCSCDGSC